MIRPAGEILTESLLALKPAKGQERFLEPVETCLKEAASLPLWRPVGIYNDTRLIGFAMYGLFAEEGGNGRLWLDRFLIGADYQGRGYGKKALSFLLGELIKEYGCRCIYLSVYEENQKAIALYRSFGFIETGELDAKGEIVMVLQNGQPAF